MNTIVKYISTAVMALTLCVGASSCSEDKYGIGSDDMLSGDYPLRLTASVEGMKSRADESSSWVDGDSIAVRIGVIGRFDRIGNYMLNADGTVMDEPSPLSWPRPKDIVKAWYPYVDMNDVKTYSLKDQSRGYHHIDFMRAESDSIHYKETVNLTFKHQMAKVSTELVRGDGFSEEEFATVKVYYTGYTGVNFSETDFNTDGFDIGLITPDSVNTALLVPRVMNNQPLITVTMTVNVNGHLIDKTLTYIASSADDLIAGYHNHYTVTVQKDRLQVNPPVSASWNDVVVGDDLNSKLWVFKVGFKEKLSIPKASRKDMVFSGNVLNEEAFRDSTVNYLEVAGNKFSITCTKSNGITPKMHMWVGDSGIDEMLESFKTVQGGEEFTFDFQLRSNNVILAYKEFAGHTTQPGDFYYSDGTWSSTLQSDKKCIAIVYKELEYKWWVDNSMEQALADIHDGGYDLTQFKDGMVHGYAVAIEDVSSSTYQWSSTRYRCNVGESSSRFPTQGVFYNGYSNMKIIERASIDKPNISFGILDACKSYKEKVETQCSSGWYLPSYDQFKEIIANKQIIQNSLKVVGGADFGTSYYWSSSEAAGTSATGGQAEDEQKAYFMQDWNKDNPGMKVAMKNLKYKVRAVLTF